MKRATSVVLAMAFLFAAAGAAEAAVRCTQVWPDDMKVVYTGDGFKIFPTYAQGANDFTASLAVPPGARIVSLTLHRSGAGPAASASVEIIRARLGQDWERVGIAQASGESSFSAHEASWSDDTKILAARGYRFFLWFQNRGGGQIHGARVCYRLS